MLSQLENPFRNSSLRFDISKSFSDLLSRHRRHGIQPVIYAIDQYWPGCHMERESVATYFIRFENDPCVSGIEDRRRTVEP
jgi:hypothetical protein